MLFSKINKYMQESFNEVLHTTLNPNGPGCVRIHLIPPDYSGKLPQSSVAVINGKDVVPVNFAWAILLAEFIRNVNYYDGRQLKDENYSTVMERTCSGVRRAFPFVSKKRLQKDVYTIMHSFTEIAYGREPDECIGYLTLGEYAPFMKAPHRMDLMVSPMTKNGVWHCNQKCVHCYAAGQKLSSEEELTTEQWKAVLNRCRDICVPQVTFTGGEPTMREDLIELVREARWFVTRLNTNGIRLDSQYCGLLRIAELDSVQITFYSSNENIHNRLVGAEHYQETLAGIRNALNAGLNVSINTPLCSLNQDYVETLKFLHNLGIIYVTCSGLITTGNARTPQSERLQLSSEEMKTVLEQALDYCAENGMELNFTSPGWVEEAFFRDHNLSVPTCGACLSNMAVTPSGNVVPCQSWLDEEPLGNILTDSWESIWHGNRCTERRSITAKMTGNCPLKRGDCTK